jgi:hypothetical protein
MPLQSVQDSEERQLRLMIPDHMPFKFDPGMKLSRLRLIPDHQLRRDTAAAEHLSDDGRALQALNVLVIEYAGISHREADQLQCVGRRIWSGGKIGHDFVQISEPEVPTEVDPQQIQIGACDQPKTPGA